MEKKGYNAVVFFEKSVIALIFRKDLFFTTRTGIINKTFFLFQLNLQNRLVDFFGQ